MAVLPYTIKENLADHHDFLLELKNFCLAQGWTIVSFLQNVSWQLSGTWQFLAGNESYLQIISSGYGSQNLQFRFRTEENGSDPIAEYLYMGAHLADTSLLDVATHPVDQNEVWNIYRFLNLPNQTIPKVWFFGNNKFVFCVLQLTSLYLEFLTFGSIELFHATGETEGNWAGRAQGSGASWYDEVYFLPFDLVGNDIYYNAEAKAYANASWNTTFGDGDYSLQKFASYGRSNIRNSYSNVRPMQKQIMMVKDSADSLWFPLGTSWIYRINSDGLNIGEELRYGSAKFLCFPGRKQGVSINNGVAVQIA